MHEQNHMPFKIQNAHVLYVILDNVCGLLHSFLHRCSLSWASWFSLWSSFFLMNWSHNLLISLPGYGTFFLIINQHVE